MKQTILASILGIAAAMAATSAQAQGFVALDNYSQSGAQVFYGSGPSAVPGTSGGTVHDGANGTAGTITWTVAVYDALGNVVGSVGSDPSGTADPSTLGGGLTFNPTGTTTFNEPGTGAAAQGYFEATSPATIAGYSSGSVTFEVVAYSGSTYDTSAYRGHSVAFALTPATGSGTPPPISTSAGGMPTFSLFTAAPVPEPSILALSGIGAAALMLIRRKK